MNKKRYLHEIVVIALLLAFIVSGCSSNQPTQTSGPQPNSSPSIEATNEPVMNPTETPIEVTTAVPTPQKGGMLRFGKAQEAVGLDPALVTATSSRILTALVYDRLVSLDDNYNPIPELAESWDINESGTIYTFHLRKGVTFHDGSELKASDVQFTFHRILNPDTASSWSSKINMIESIEVIDDYTVRFVLSQPYGAFITTLDSDWASIVPQAAVEEYGDLQTHMDGAGPFILSEYTPNTRTVLTTNQNYWGEIPSIDGIIFTIIPDEASRLAALRSGDLDMAQLSDPAAVSMASRSENLVVFSQPTVDYYMVGINTTRPPLNDVRVRQAMSLAIDRQAALNTVLFGDGLVSGPIPPTLGKWALPISEMPLFQQDTQKAKDLLAEAGYPDGFSFEILASPQYPQFVSIALVLQQQLSAVGIDATIKQVEWGDFITLWKARDFDTFVSYQTAGSDPDYALYGYFRGGSAFNAVQLSDPDVDKHLDLGRTTIDNQARMTIYTDAQKALALAVPDLFLFTRTEYMGASKNVDGFYLTAVNTFTYPGLRKVWISK